jgi:hypothetical protein
MKYNQPSWPTSRMQLTAASPSVWDSLSASLTSLLSRQR